MKEAVAKTKIRDLPICFLVTFGHCGIDYMHSLLDSHPQTTYAFV